MNSRPSLRGFFAALSLVAAIAPSGCIAEGYDDFVEENDENVSFTSDPIIGGTSVTAQYPEAATINMTDASGNVWICSATLIAPKVVLTAGHCVDKMKTWQVKVGTQSRTTTRGATFDWTDGFNINWSHHDIGLLFLDQPIVLSSYPTIATTQAPANSTLLNVGRIHNGQTDTLWGVTTTSLGTASQLPFVYYSTMAVVESGDSGGPDFLVGTHTIAAVNSAVAPGSFEYLARVDLIHEWITRPIDDSTFFVRGLYLDVLKREPDAAGLAFWVNALNACNGASACLASTRVATALGILKSQENVTQDPDLNPASAGYKSAFVNHCFTNLLRRQPDAAGHAYWLAFLNSTSDYSAVVSGFITSPEYRQRFGMQ